MEMETARWLVSLAGPVPDDLQHLAYETFKLTPGDSIGKDEVAAGLSRAVGRLESLYRDVDGLLSAGQRRVLDQLAREPTSSPSSAAFVRSTGLAKRLVCQAGSGRIARSRARGRSRRPSSAG